MSALKEFILLVNDYPFVFICLGGFILVVIGMLKSDYSN